jgi:RNA polymerase primary sigma factor
MDKNRKSLNTYLNEIGREQRLTDEEERQLAIKISQGDSRALEKLTSANLTYVVSLAHQYEDRGLAVEDLISEGNIGMMQAATRFDGNMGKRFVMFAAPYIRQAMEQAIEQQAGLYRVPRNVADTRLEKRRSRALSIDAPVGGSTELSLGRVIPDANASLPDDAVESEGAVRELRELVGQLPDREARVMRALYALDGNAHTMKETADEMGMKRERVRQIRDRALRRISKMTRNTMLKDYLNL